MVTLLVEVDNGLLAGDALAPVKGYYVDPAQEVEPVSVQEYEVLPAQKYEAFPSQKHAAGKYAVPVPIERGCCEPKIIYRHHRCCKKRHCCSCESSCQVILPVADPDCCQRIHSIPVPAPPCCQGVPSGKSRRGLFCRGLAVFKWPCGYKVKVVFSHKGDVVVHTFGVPVRTPVVTVGSPVLGHPTEHRVYSPVPTPAPPPEDGPELAPPGARAF